MVTLNCVPLFQIQVGEVITLDGQTFVVAAKENGQVGLTDGAGNLRIVPSGLMVAR